MKNWKALFGTVLESISGPQQLSFRNLEDWDNLWQVIIALKHSRNSRVYYWECMTEYAYRKNQIKIDEWYGEKIYATDLLISMEYEINNPKQWDVYIRRAYARRLKTPVEIKLNIDPTFFSEKEARPYIHHFTDRNGNLTNSYSVIYWLELIDIWSKNGNFKPYVT